MVSLPALRCVCGSALSQSMRCARGCRRHHPCSLFRCPPRSLCSLPALATATHARPGCRPPAPPGLAPGGLRPPPCSVSSTLSRFLLLSMLSWVVFCVAYVQCANCHHRRHARYSRSSMRNPAPCATRTAGTGSKNPSEKRKKRNKIVQKAGKKVKKIGKKLEKKLEKGQKITRPKIFLEKVLQISQNKIL